jgi:hypothetical protein
VAAAAHVDAERAEREAAGVDALAGVAAQHHQLGPRQRADQPQLGGAQVLDLVDDDGVERRGGAPVVSAVSAWRQSMLQVAR